MVGSMLSTVEPSPSCPVLVDAPAEDAPIIRQGAVVIGAEGERDQPAHRSDLDGRELAHETQQRSPGRFFI